MMNPGGSSRNDSEVCAKQALEDKIEGQYIKMVKDILVLINLDSHYQKRYIG